MEPSPSRARLVTRKVHGAVLLLAALVTSSLLGVAAGGLFSVSTFLGLTASVLVVALCAAGWLGALRTWSAAGYVPAPSRRAQWLVLAAFPVALVGSVFDCGGFSGCTDACGVLNTRWLPVIGVLLLAHLIRPWAGSLLLVSVFSFVLLVPHCDCYNVINRAWIDLLGASPACFSGSFAVGLVTVGAMASGRDLRIAAVSGWSTALALIAFAIGHHRFGWPW